jgi:DNA-binding Xre family transcriptional regulator
MTTLRDLWIARGMTSTEVASRAGISVPTLYRANRKERVYNKNLKDICKVLGITLDEYNALEVCPMADRYRKES